VFALFVCPICRYIAAVNALPSIHTPGDVVVLKVNPLKRAWDRASVCSAHAIIAS